MSGRSLVSASVVRITSLGPVFQCLCDCGTVTDVTLADLQYANIGAGVLEVAFTCDGCETSHWLTLTPTAQH